MIKTRFAPSPTWYLHIWGLRTVLYDYFHAKKNDWIFLLRIEDTDRTRLVEWSIENLLEILEIFWLTPDEWPNNNLWNGPYIQSERLEIYQKYIQKMLDEWTAYKCFCSKERIDELRKEQESLKLPSRYDGHCKHLSPEEIKWFEKNNTPHVVRLKVNKWEKLIFKDLIRWKIEINSSEVDDQILIKSDGFPTYHFAVVIDDHLMKITHVLRWEEWIPSIPKQVLIAQWLWIELPEYAHLPVITAPWWKKLSKRDDNVAVEDFLKEWYLIESLLNYIAFLGWNPKSTEELFSLDEMTEKFDLKDVHKSSAVFDEKKLEWYNCQYIMNMTSERLLDYLDAHYKKYDNEFSVLAFENHDKNYNLSIISELKTRIKKLSDFKELTWFFYNEPEVNTDLLLNPKMKIENLEIAEKSLQLGLEILKSNSKGFKDIDTMKDIFISEIQKRWQKNWVVLWPIRVGLSWAQFSPWAFELINILWVEQSIIRIEKVLNNL